jgi:hypothetical protein
MSAYATGKKAFGISDRSGLRYLLKDMKKEWNGLLVGKDEWEQKHPQLKAPKASPDPQALRDPRPDTRTEPAVDQLLSINPFLSGNSGTSVITVTENSHGRSTGDTVRFRKANGFDGFSKTAIQDQNGYTITVLNTNQYTIDLTDSAETATTGNQRGGGKNATVGPVTLES